MINERSGQRFLAQTLLEARVTHVFGVPAAFVGALNRMDEDGVRVISTHGEVAAACMADGYARASGSIGICYAQSVGAAGIACGLRDASLVGVPVIALTGASDPMTAHRFAYQDCDDSSMFDPVTKLNVVVRRVDRFPDMLRLAAQVATASGPGPVHLGVEGATGQLLDQRISTAFWDTSVLQDQRIPRHRFRGDSAKITQAAVLLNQAERPVLLAGGGARLSEAGPEIRQLAHMLGIPVVTSLNAKGIFDENDPLACGVAGMYSRSSANRVLLEADLVIVVGSRAGGQVTNNWTLFGPETRTIQIDIDPQVLGRNFVPTVPILGDARSILQQLILEGRDESGQDRPAGIRSGWLSRAAEFVREFRQTNLERSASGLGSIRPERLCMELNSILPDDCVFVSDTGHASWWSGSLLDLKPGQLFLRAAGTLGWSIPAALGAKCAFPNRPVICFSGDGGFLSHVGELETAARYALPVVFIVNNNCGFSQDVAIYREKKEVESGSFRKREYLEFSQTDIAGLARAFGCQGYHVEDLDELQSTLARALDCNEPTVVNVVTDRTAVPDEPLGGSSFRSSMAD